MTCRVKRCISLFKKGNDDLAGEIKFAGDPDIRMLRKIFDIKDEADEMVDDYPLHAHMEMELADLVQGDFDFENYDYFLSCECVR